MSAFYKGEADKAKQDPKHQPREARVGDLVTGQADGVPSAITGRVVRVEGPGQKRPGQIEVAHVDRSSTIFTTETGQALVHASLATGAAERFELVG